MNRRSFLSTGTALGVGSLVFPSLLGTKSAFALPTLSAADVNAAQAAVATLVNEGNAQSATSLDVQAAATSLAILFANMQETGYSSAVTPQMITGLQNQLKIGTDQSLRMHSLLTANGIQVTSAQAAQIFNPGPEAVQSMITTLQSPGLNAELQALAFMLKAAALRMQNDGIKTVSSRIAYSPHAHLVRVHCAEDGIACGVLGLMSPPPIDVVMGGLGLIYGLLDLFGAC